MPQGIDRREIPLYTVADVAHYLHIPYATLRSWLFETAYPTPAGTTRISRPLINPADGVGARLSFFNLVEAHIIKATRQRDGVRMAAIRDALDYAAKKDASRHPLITGEFLTEGRFLFERRMEDELVNASKQGQLAFSAILDGFLARIDRDSVGYPMTLYPFVPNKPESRAVAIKPGVSSGVPTIRGTGISIPILQGRYLAGDSFADLADDYDLKIEEVEDAINYIQAA